MDKNKLIELGSKTAKDGFRNEDDVVRKFNNYQHDENAQSWLEIMGYKISEIEKIVALKLHGFKTDVQIQVTIYFKDAINLQNLSIKLVSNPQGFNQVDKRWVDKYVEMWDIPKEVEQIFSCF